MNAVCKRPAAVVLMTAAALFPHGVAAQSRVVTTTPKQSGTPAKEKLLGAWRLVRIDGSEAERARKPGPQPQGMLIYTPDGHVSVQLMYPPSAAAFSNQYVSNGYEASFGTFEVDEAARIVTHHIQGSITRGQLVGKSLARKFEFRPNGQLVLRSADPGEHWSVTWQHE